MRGTDSSLTLCTWTIYEAIPSPLPPGPAQPHQLPIRPKSVTASSKATGAPTLVPLPRSSRLRQPRLSPSFPRKSSQLLFVTSISACARGARAGRSACSYSVSMVSCTDVLSPYTGLTAAQSQSPGCCLSCISEAPASARYSQLKERFGS